MGRPPKTPPEKVCYLVATHGEPVVDVSDVYTDMDMTKRGAQERLKKLTEAGYLESKKVGSSARVFWLTGDGRSAAADFEP
jgi:predicted ArsR family transcriptional regulator